jgi:hypothetical protein
MEVVKRRSVEDSLIWLPSTMSTLTVPPCTTRFCKPNVDIEGLLDYLQGWGQEKWRDCRRSGDDIFGRGGNVRCADRVGVRHVFPLCSQALTGTPVTLSTLQQCYCSLAISLPGLAKPVPHAEYRFVCHDFNRPSAGLIRRDDDQVTRPGTRHG